MECIGEECAAYRKKLIHHSGGNGRDEYEGACGYFESKIRDLPWKRGAGAGANNIILSLRGRRSHAPGNEPKK
jgi:hypothetical protein